MRFNWLHYMHLFDLTQLIKNVGGKIRFGTWLLLLAIIVSVIPPLRGVSTLTISLFCLFFALMAYGLRTLLKGDVISFSKDMLVIFALIVVLFLQFVNSDISSSHFESTTYKSYITLNLSLFAYIAVRSRICNNQRSCLLILDGILLQGAILSGLMLVLFYYVGSIIGSNALLEIRTAVYHFKYHADVDTYTSVVSALGTQNFFASYYGRTIEIGVLLSMTGAMGVTLILFQGKKSSVLLCMIVLINIISLLSIYSRGAMLSFLFAISLASFKTWKYILRFKSHGFFVLVILTGFVLYVTMAPSEYNAIKAWMLGAKTSDYGRFHIYYSIFEDWLRHPFGNGFDALRVKGLYGVRVEHAHSLFFRILNDTGLPGILLSLLLLVDTAAKAWRLYRTKPFPGSISQAVGGCLLAGIISVSISALFNDIDRFYVTMPTFILFAITHNFYDHRLILMTKRDRHSMNADP